MRRIFAVSSIVFLAVLAVSPAKSYFTEWRRYQSDYNRILEQLPMRVKPVQPGIHQTWIPELGVVDRCTSCHLGVDRPELATASQPFRTHPPLAHDTEELGCTPCHRGQGRGTTLAEAHGRTEFWDEPLVPRQYLEASCGHCHAEQEVKDAPQLSRGRHLVRQLNCAGCHRLGDGHTSSKRSLDGIGTKTTRAWLDEWLHDPRTFRPHTRMPDFRLNEDEAGVLAEFLVTFRTPLKALEPLPEVLSGEEPDEALVELGKTRFREARCISCHAVEGKGGTLAPDLAKVASKLSPVWLYSFLGDPQGLAPGIQMPRYGFTTSDRTAVVAYILSEFVDWDAEEEGQATFAASPNSFEEGLRLFNHYNCWGCHELSGVARSEEMGPDLTDVGRRRVYDVEFGNASIERSLPAYLHAKLEDPRQFLPNSRMPHFDLSDDDDRAVTTAMLAMSEAEVPEAYRAPVGPVSGDKPQGEFGRILDRYSCLSCHTSQGRGYRLATDLTFEGSRVQEEWLRRYFKVPYSLRPILPERMPNLFLPDADASILVNHMKMVLVNDEIDRVPSPAPELAPLGQQLLYARYSCLACHQIGGEGGYVGPPLDGVGSRLRPGWIYKWLQNPQRYRPDTIEPNEGLGEHELLALTAYLSSLK